MQQINIKLKLIRFEVMFIVHCTSLSKQPSHQFVSICLPLLLTYYVICWIVEVSSVWIAEEFKKFVRLQLLFNSLKQMHHKAQDSKLYCNLVGLYIKKCLIDDSCFFLNCSKTNLSILSFLILMNWLFDNQILTCIIAWTFENCWPPYHPTLCSKRIQICKYTDADEKYKQNTNKNPKPQSQCSMCSRRIQKVFDCFPTLSHKCIKYNRQLHLDFLSFFDLKSMIYHKVDKPACLIIRWLFRFAADSLEQWQW